MKRSVSVKRIIRLIVSLMLVIVLLPVPESVRADDAIPETCMALTGSNKNAQNYGTDGYNWAAPVYSYLIPCDSGYMTVQGNVNGRGVMACYYDGDFDLVSRKEIASELPLFGGFCEYGGAYYIVSGQENRSENDSAEVFRVTKYDKNWKKISSCSLYGENTTVPFDGGSLRFAGSGKYLAVRTCHEMYAIDGINHQANVTFMVDTETMTITQCDTGITNNGTGYVSHSFNQFIGIDDGKLVAVDHGDAGPRSICLMNYSVDFTSSGIYRSGYYSVTTTDILTFTGATGDNFTGASVGGFEVADDHYLIAGNAVMQDENSGNYMTDNVFVAAVDKNTKAVTINYITHYKEGEKGTNTPHMVKVSDGKYIVLWSREGTVYYTFVNEYGAQDKNGKIYSLAGALSDCRPLVKGGNIIWYTWKNEDVTFYSIPADDPENPEIRDSFYGHDLKLQSMESGLGTFVCSKCGTVVSGNVPVELVMLWNTEKYGGYSSIIPEDLSPGDTVYYWAHTYYYEGTGSDIYLDDLIFTSSDPQNCYIDEENLSITFKGEGLYKITVRAKYNPDVCEEYYFNTTKTDLSVTLGVSAPPPQPYGTRITLSADVKGGIGPYRYRFMLQYEDGSESVIREYSSSPYAVWDLPAAGDYRLAVDVMDQGDNNKTVTSEYIPYSVAMAERPSVMPAESYSVPYSTETLTNDILSGIPNWSFFAEDIGTELEAGETSVFTAYYTGSDAGNYEIETADVYVTRSFCEHDGRTKTVGAVAPTCVTEGETGDTVCLICLEVIEASQVLPKDPDNHTNIITVPAVLPTETEDGLSSYKKCNDCGVMITTPEVTPALGTLKVEPDSLYLMPNEKGRITVTQSSANADIVWASGDGSIAKVSQTGEVAAVKQGKTVITAKDRKSGKTAECSVRVTFYDVPMTHSFSGHVYWAADSGITGGYSGSRAGYFGIKDPVQRGQVVMFLWRMAGQPEPESNEQTFKDVPVTHNFYKAIQWAYEQGIAAGYSGKRANTFGPKDNCTRGQTAMFLWRFAGKPEVISDGVQAFDDVPVKHNFYKAIKWANDNGIAGGYTGARAGQFGVNDDCTRGQMVTFLHRYALKE